MTKTPSQNVRSAIRNSAFGLSAIIAQLLGTSFAFFIIARIPGISIGDFGVLTYAFALAQLFAVCFEYGLTPYLARETAAMKGGRIPFEMAGYGLHLTLMLIGFSLFLALLPFLNLSPLAVTVSKWIGASVFLTSTMRFFFAYYQGREKLHLEFLSSLSEITILLAVIAAAVIKQADVVTLAKFFFLGRCLAWVAAYVLLGLAEFWLLPKFNRLVWSRILVDALPFAFTFLIAFAITSIDTVLLQQLAPNDPEREVGLYQAALRIILVPTILAMVVTKVFLPQLSRIGEDDPDSVTIVLRHLNDTLHTIGLLFGVFFLFHADSLVRLAYGSQYSDAAGLVKVLGITLILRFGAAYNLYFALKGKMWLRVIFALGALTSAILLNIILIPRYGALGVAYASVITHLVYWVPFLLAMKSFEGAFLMGWRIWRAILAAGVFYMLLVLSKNLHFVVNLIWGGVFIAATAFLFADQSIRQRVIYATLGRR